MTANSSCDWPKIAPFFSFTPITRKWAPSILMILSSGFACPNSRSAVPQPSSTTLRLRSTSLGLSRRPRSALYDEKFTYSADTPRTLTLSSSFSWKATCPGRLLSAITDRTSGLNFRMASASLRVIRGLLRTFSKSSSLRVTPKRSTTKESAPTSDTIASVTVAFRPWMSDTTAMIDVTATILPSTLMNERSLLLQMARSAMKMPSRIRPTVPTSWRRPAASPRRRPSCRGPS